MIYGLLMLDFGSALWHDLEVHSKRDLRFCKTKYLDLTMHVKLINLRKEYIP